MPSRPIIKTGGQGVTPATLSTIRPGTPVVPLTPQEEEILNEVARKQGIDKAEVMRRVMERLPPQPQPRPTVTDQSLSKIEQARQLSLTSDDPNDPLNQMMRYGFYKDLRKDFKKGDEERMSTREMMEMAILQRMLPDNGGPNASVQQFQQMMNDLKADNEKQRQFYEQRLKEQDEKIKDMIFEKKLQTMQDTQAETMNSLNQQIADISQRLELYKSIPPSVTPDLKRDAISHLEDLGNQISRIKKALEPLGIISSSLSSAPPTPGGDPYKKADGSVDYFRYAVDKIDSNVKTITDAWQKKTPERRTVEETPQPEENQQTQRTTTPEEYADYLMSKPNRAPQEQQWLNDYSAYLERQRAKLTGAQRYKPPVQERREVEQPVERPVEKVEQPAAQQIICERCGRESYNGTTVCDECIRLQEMTSEPKKSALDKIKEMEDEQIRRAHELGL